MAAEQDPGVAKDMAIKLLKETFQDQEEVEELFTNVKTRADIIASNIEQHSIPQAQDQNLMASMVADSTKIMAITRSETKNMQVSTDPRPGRKFRIPGSKGAINLRTFSGEKNEIQE